MTFNPVARADFVIERGILTKNRFGSIGINSIGTDPFPDGCYQIVQIGMPKKRTQQRTRKRSRR
jgi:hypothetical protein